MTQQLFFKSTSAAWYLEQSVNHLLWTQKFDEVEWVTTGVTVTTGQIDPSAGTTAATITATTADATFLQTLELLNGALTRSFSIYLKRVAGVGEVSLTLDGLAYTAKTITAAFVRYDITGLAGGVVRAGVKLSTAGDAVTIAFAQLETGAVSAYAANGENEYTVFSVTDPDYPINTARGCVFMDGRFFVMSPSGDIQQSALEDAASWSSLEFIKSQIDAGRGIYLARIKNYIVSFKDWSTEFFYDAANPTGSILSPVQNAAFQIGCASDGSVQEMADTICWIGQTRLGFGRGVYVLQGTEAQNISTPSVDKILDNDSLAVVHSWSASVGSHVLYGITLAASEVTVVFDFSSKLWSFFTYLEVVGAAATVVSVSATGLVTTATPHGLVDGDIVKISQTTVEFNGWHVVTDVSASMFQIQAAGLAHTGTGTVQGYQESYFPIVSSVRAEGKQYMQDATNGGLYEFSQSVYRDEVGAIAVRVRTPKIDDGSSKNKAMASAELVGDKVDSTAVIRHSDDDYATYSSFRPVDLGARRSRIRRLGKTTRRSFEILHLGNALVRLEAIELGD